MRRPTCDAYQSHCSVAHYLPSLKSDTQRGLDEIRSTLSYANPSRPLPTGILIIQRNSKNKNKNPGFVSIPESEGHIIRTISDRESSTTFRSASTSQLGGVGVQERRDANRPDLITSRTGQRQSPRRTRRSQPARGSWKLWHILDEPVSRGCVASRTSSTPRPPTGHRTPGIQLCHRVSLPSGTATVATGDLDLSDSTTTPPCEVPVGDQVQRLEKEPQDPFTFQG